MSINQVTYPEEDRLSSLSELVLSDPLPLSHSGRKVVGKRKVSSYLHYEQRYHWPSVRLDDVQNQIRINYLSDVNRSRLTSLISRTNPDPSPTPEGLVRSLSVPSSASFGRLRSLSFSTTPPLSLPFPFLLPYSPLYPGTRLRPPSTTATVDTFSLPFWV